MPGYRITNRITKERAQVDAPFAQVACELLGWLIGECFVELTREGPYSDITKRPIIIRPKAEGGENGR